MCAYIFLQLDCPTVLQYTFIFFARGGVDATADDRSRAPARLRVARSRCRRRRRRRRLRSYSFCSSPVILMPSVLKDVQGSSSDTPNRIHCVTIFFSPA